MFNEKWRMKNESLRPPVMLCMASSIAQGAAAAAAVFSFGLSFPYAEKREGRDAGNHKQNQDIP